MMGSNHITAGMTEKYGKKWEQDRGRSKRVV